MTKIDFDSLKQYDLTFPGICIESEDQDYSLQTDPGYILRLIQSLFNEAVVSVALFQPITAQNVSDFLNKEESSYERCLNSLYAKAFVFALHSIDKLINQLSKNMNSPKQVKRLYNEYKKHFGQLKHIRDSAIHIEDRGCGVTRKQQKINAHVIILSCFNEKRYIFTGEDGKQYEIEISDNTLKLALNIIQNIINSYSWIKFGA